MIKIHDYKTFRAYVWFWKIIRGVLVSSSLTLVPAFVVFLIESKSHTMKATRYVLILTLCWNLSTIRFAPFREGEEDIRGMLKRDLKSCSLTMDIENLAFMAGSSKHGKAWRAAVASNWVAARYLENFNAVFVRNLQNHKKVMQRQIKSILYKAYIVLALGAYSFHYKLQLLSRMNTDKCVNDADINYMCFQLFILLTWHSLNHFNKPNYTVLTFVSTAS